MRGWLVSVASPGGFSQSDATGPFATSYAAYRHAMAKRDPLISGDHRARLRQVVAHNGFADITRT